MGFTHENSVAPTGSSLHFNSVTPYLLAIQLAISLCFVNVTLAGAGKEQRVFILQSYHKVREVLDIDAREK